MSRSIRTRVARLEGTPAAPSSTTLWEVIGGGDPARLDAAGRRLLAELCTRPGPDELGVVEQRLQNVLESVRAAQASTGR